MKVVVIGAGLIGLCTAYYLRKRGYEVTVIDRQGGPGRETSFANGALVTPSQPEPWNSPGCWRVLLSSLARSDAPLQLRVRALPSLMGWGVRFLRNSSLTRYQTSSIRNVRLALFSLQALRSLREEAGIAYGASAKGILKLFRDPQALKGAYAAADHLLPEGLNLRVMSREEAIELEPALGPIGHELAGAIHCGVDETGDAHQFCLKLAEHLQQKGVSFIFGTSVSGLEARSARLMFVRTAHQHLLADHFVVAAGSYTTPLLNSLGLRLPVRPAKGYSVTFNAPRGPVALSVPIVDDAMHVALVPIGNAVRIAGTAEFAGFDLTLRPERVRNLTQLAEKILPRSGLDPSKSQPWCGLRAMSADGVPLIGRTPIENLWVSTGHGHLGWTMAAGSGQLLAELIDGVRPSLDPGAYSPSRFAM